MKKRREPRLPARLARGQERFERWRSKQKRRTRLPEQLWSAAVRLAREYGVNRTARTLRLEYNGLKKRVETTPAGEPSSDAAGPKFIELLGSELTAPAECAIECRNPEGATIRIQFKGPELPDLAALCQKLWPGDR